MVYFEYHPIYAGFQGQPALGPRRAPGGPPEAYDIQIENCWYLKPGLDTKKTVYYYINLRNKNECEPAAIGSGSVRANQGP